MNVLKNTYIFKVWKVFFPITVLLFVYMEAKRLFSKIDFELAIYKIQEIGLLSFLCLVLFGIFAVCTMILYDVIIVRELNIEPKHYLIKSFAFNSYANFFGFGGFAGVGLRTFFYRERVEKLSQLLKWTTVILPFMLTGLSLLAYFVLVTEWKKPFMLETYPVLKVPLFLMCIFTPLFLIGSIWTKKVRFSTQIKLITVSLLEWIVAGILFILVAYSLQININISILILLFILAATAGVISTVPGGLGAFDFVMLVGLSHFAVTEERTVALLLLYRIVYYFLPFIFSSIILGCFMQKEKRWGLFIPSKESFERSAYRISVVFVLIVGMLLLVFPVAPAIVHRLKWADQFLSLQVMQVSQQVSIIIGILLLVLARSLYDQVKRAYYATSIILLIGVIFSFSKGFQFGESIILLFAALLLRTSKNQYYRKSSPYTFGKGIVDGIIVFLLSILYVGVGVLQIPIIKRYVPSRFQELFSLQMTELMIDIVIGVVLSIALAYVSLFWKGEKYGFTKSKTKKTYFLPKSSMYIHKEKRSYWYYEKWMDKILINMKESNNIDRTSLLAFQKNIDLYGYKIIYVQIPKSKMDWIEKENFYIIDNYGFPKEIPTFIAKLYVKAMGKYKK